MLYSNWGRVWSLYPTLLYTCVITSTERHGFSLINVTLLPFLQLCPNSLHPPVTSSMFPVPRPPMLHRALEVYLLLNIVFYFFPKKLMIFPCPAFPAAGFFAFAVLVFEVACCCGLGFAFGAGSSSENDSHACSSFVTAHVISTI